MRKTAGFTLIELVIVIVILGILGAVAAPKFINLQDDAYEANVKALKGSIQSAITLANTRAILDGKENGTDVAGFDGVTFIAGYPKADTVTEGVPAKDGILGALQDFDSSSYTVAEVPADGDDTASITIRPKNRDDIDTCQVQYFQARKAAAATTDPVAAAQTAKLPKIVANVSSCNS